VRTIRLPVHMHELRNSLERVRRELSQALGREPRVDELARASGVAIKKIEQIQRVEREPTSLEAPLSRPDGSGFSLSTRVADESTWNGLDQIVDEQRRKRLRALLGVVTERERRVLTKRFGLDDEAPRTLQQIADELAVTRERVRQIQAKAMEKVTRVVRRRGLEFDDF
jgi:RNA polymerase primary sigma factor